MKLVAQWHGMFTLRCHYSCLVGYGAITVVLDLQGPEGTYCHHLQGWFLKMEAVYSSETVMAAFRVPGVAFSEASSLLSELWWGCYTCTDRRLMLTCDVPVSMWNVAVCTKPAQHILWARCWAKQHTDKIVIRAGEWECWFLSGLAG